MFLLYCFSFDCILNKEYYQVKPGRTQPQATAIEQKQYQAKFSYFHMISPNTAEYRTR